MATERGKSFKVDLETPDIEVFVEVRDDKSYLYAETLQGPGGLPVGSQGRVLVLLKDLHSLIAAWLMMKRGCTIHPVHFEGPTGRRSRADEFEAVLRSWYFRGKVEHVAHTEVESFPRQATCVLCMRQMIRKAGHLARYKKCKAIVTGEAFSSSTIDNLLQFATVNELPVLRPILGTTPAMVSEFLSAMGLDPRSAPVFEPCPLRVHGAVPAEDVPKLEDQLGLAAIAKTSVEERERVREARA
jgi:tRNA uracil 4-sulfurtransferase